MRPAPRLPGRLGNRLGFVAAAFLLAALPATAAAHVNRTAGPYTFLVVLVEEPVFADNHAGFQFWVRRDGVPITGLERTLHPRATGHGASLDLEIPPLDGLGFYVLDRSIDGATFDPLGGGSWTLELSGTIEQTPVDVTFPVVFPAYPRVGVAPPQAGGAQALPQQGSGAVPWALPLAVGGVGLTLVLFAQLRRGRFRPIASDHSHNS